MLASHLGPLVLRELSRLLPGALPYDPHWKTAHPIYWTHSTSFEHLRPWAAGGTHELDNVITACSLCQYAKNVHSLDSLGLMIVDPIDSEWRGLTEHLDDLKTLSPERHDS